MAVSLPTSADVRKARTQANKVVNSQFEIVKTPLLAWVGVGDYAVTKVNEAVSEARTRAAERRELAAKRAKKLRAQAGELPNELNADGLRARVEDVTEQARKTYADFANRGEKTIEKIRKQPRVKRALKTVSDATDELDKRVEKAVDEVHDVGEEVLGRVTFETRSVGEKAARATQRLAGEAAEVVSETSDDLSESLNEAGDEAASTTRSVTRKAANRTAPKKPTTTRRTNNAAE